MAAAPDVEGLLRESAPRALAAVTRRFGRFADAEDAVQEALLEAAEQWPREGAPESPAGWLVHVASRRLTDRARSESARRRREEEVAADRSETAADGFGKAVLAGPVDALAAGSEADDSLVLILICCHPALSPASAVALTLRAVGGLTTAAIAAAFLVPERTMGQRISRAKATIRAAPEPFALPGPEELPARLRAALRVVYLIFNEGYAASEGAELARAELSEEAIRLARMVHAARPQEPEATGLLALLLLTDARRPARVDAAGALVPLEQQDRALWERAKIAEGTALLAEAVGHGAVGEYQLQAAIAAVHDRAPSAAATDWAEVLALYGLLAELTGNPMVELNRAIAAAMAEGADAGLERLAPLEERLGDHHRLHATRAHLLEMKGEREAAVAEYEAAAVRTNSLPERDYLTKRAARLRAT
jgi:RNA polymerase sigma factor (sigma-70 family)